MPAGIVDIVVVGGGMVGSAATALLSRAGFEVAIIEARETPEFSEDSDIGLRVSAVSPGSAAVLSEAGAWQRIESSRHCHYRRMHVEDRDGQGAIDFDAPAFGLDRLGTICENDLVQSALWEVLAQDRNVHVHCPQRVNSIELSGEGATVSLESGDRVQARLLVGADGGSSRVRSVAGIDSDYWAYNQKGVVCVVETAQPNPGTAWQRFGPGGPIAFLPLADGRSSIVWTQPDAQADCLLKAEDDAFKAELNAFSGAPFGSVESIGPRAAFPLTMRLAERYVSPGVVLLGDAAHVVHPMAGQGVNLGLLDAAALVERLVLARQDGRSPGDPETLRSFDRWRRSESEWMAQGIHGLRTLFAPDGLSVIRRLGMRLLNSNAIAREPFLRRAAGLNENAPALARGARVIDLVAGSGKAQSRGLGS